MCSSLCSLLAKHLPLEEAALLENYLLKLSPSALQCITVSKATAAMAIPKEKTLRLLNLCCDLDILRIEFAIRCPECGLLLKRVGTVDEIEEICCCYGCSTEFDVTAENIEVIFCVNESSFFQIGQLENPQTLPSRVVQFDSLAELVRNDYNFNKLFFHPTEEQYQEWEMLYDNLTTPKPTTKAKGDALEQLFLSLLNATNGLRAVAIKTKTNQIDGAVRCQIASCLPFLGERIIVECKNEKKKPDNTYYYKISGIIDGINGGGTKKIVRLGIIVSRKAPASTVKVLAFTRYTRDGLVIVSLDFNDLKAIIKDRQNLLEMIERKRDEIAFNSTTQLVKVGIFDA